MKSIPYKLNSTEILYIFVLNHILCLHLFYINLVDFTFVNEYPKGNTFNGARQQF